MWFVVIIHRFPERAFVVLMGADCQWAWVGLQALPIGSRFHHMSLPCLSKTSHPWGWGVALKRLQTLRLLFFLGKWLGRSYFRPLSVAAVPEKAAGMFWQHRLSGPGDRASVERMAGLAGRARLVATTNSGCLKRRNLTHTHTLSGRLGLFLLSPGLEPVSPKEKRSSRSVRRSILQRIHLNRFHPLWWEPKLVFRLRSNTMCQVQSLLSMHRKQNKKGCLRQQLSTNTQRWLMWVLYKHLYNS